MSNDPNISILSDKEKIAQLLYTSIALRKLADRIKNLESRLSEIKSKTEIINFTTESNSLVTIPYLDCAKYTNGVFWVHMTLTGDDSSISALYGGEFTGIFKVENNLLINRSGAWQNSDDAALGGTIIDFSASGNTATMDITPINANPIIWKLFIEIK